MARASSGERIAAALLLVALVATLWTQAASLYTTPTIDSYRWYGDESWLMSVWKTQFQTGEPRYPEAVGSTLSHTVGFLSHGAEWLNVMVYGGPLAILPSTWNPVKIGRIVTFILYLGLLGLIAWYLARHGIRPLFIILSEVLLVTTRTFFNASHSARYDIVTALLITLFVLYFDNLRRKGMELRRWWLVGFSFAIASFVVGAHPLVLLPLFGVYVFASFDGYTKARHYITVAVGSMIGVGVLVLLYVAKMGRFLPFGEKGAGNQYYSVLSSFPILHFFSRSAQLHQLWARGYYLRTEAPQFIPVLAAIMVLSVVSLRSTNPKLVSSAFLAGSVFSILFGALFVENLLPNYLTHVLPLIAVLFAFQMEALVKSNGRAEGVANWGAGLTSLALLGISLSWAANATAIGSALTTANAKALDSCERVLLRDIARRGGAEKRALVLTQAPAQAYLAANPRLAIMSESFLMFPIDTSAPGEVLHRYSVDYFVSYHYPLSMELEETVAKEGIPLLTLAGHFVDRNQKYDQQLTNQLDTLTLYALYFNK